MESGRSQTSDHTSAGPAAPSGSPVPPRSLWGQRSFYVAAGLCAFWIGFGASDQNMAPADRLIGAITLVAVTVLGYLGYRRARGWKAIPAPQELRLAAPTARRIALGGLGLVLIAAIGVALGLMPRSSTNAPNAGTSPWAKSMAATTCGDWLSAMTQDQRHSFAAALLASDIAKAASDQARANLQSNTADQYVSMITDTCNTEAPSSLVVQ